MKVNVYAEEMQEIEHPTIVHKISDGIPYIGLHFGVAEHDGVTFWFNNRNDMVNAMYNAVNVANGVIQT